VTPNQFAYHVHLAHTLLPHGDRPTRKHMRVARMLARWQHPSPSHAKLARAAGCCVRTVQNALNRLRGLGLLDWRQQRWLSRWSGWRRLANRYLFNAPFSLLAVPLRQKVLTPESTLGKHAIEALATKWGLR